MSVLVSMTDIENDTKMAFQPTKMQDQSLFIPRVHNSLKEKDIERIFNRLKFGEIKRIDIIVPGMKHDPHQEIEESITCPPDPLPLFNICFIHYSSWNMESETVQRFYKQVFENDEEVRIQYDAAGHFFKVFKNKNPKPDEQYELEQAFMKQQKIIQKLNQRCSFYESLFNNMEDLFKRLSENMVDDCPLPRPPFIVGHKYEHTDGSLFEFVEEEDGTHHFVLVE